MKWYAYEFQNTLDGTLNFSEENLGDKQLCFSPENSIYEPNDVRYIEYDAEIEEGEAVKLFEKRFNVKCEWSSISSGKFNHLGYKIIDNN